MAIDQAAEIPAEKLDTSMRPETIERWTLPNS